MVDSNKIIQYLNDNGIDEVEELKSSEEQVVVRFFYDFDEDEIKSARAYAKDECEEEEESEAWYEDFYLPYLNDLAIDNIGEIMQEAMDKFQVEAQYVSYEADQENSDYCEFIAVIYKKGISVEIESILEEMNL
jgi:hypothetical protein